jgi:hypothetical protein
MSNPEFADLLGEDFKQQHVRWKPEDDAKLIVRFFSAAVLLSHASEQLKKPKVVQSDFISIRLDEYSEYVTEVGYIRDSFGHIQEVAGVKVPHPKREEYLARFPKAWEVYQRQYERAEGTPLSQLKGIALNDIAQLGVFKIFTIEALADAPDRLFLPSGAQPAILDTRDDGGSFIALREAARRHIKENGEFEAIVRAKDEARAEAEQLKALVAKLQAELGATGPNDAEKIALHNEQLAQTAKLEARVKEEKRR